MRKINILLILITLLMFASIINPSFASSSSNYDIAKAYAKSHYPNCKVVLLKSYNAKKIEHRKGKNIVYIELCKSISSGKKDPRNGMYWGYEKGSNYYKCWYNAKVKKGKTVTQYFIYNPYTNYCDDVVAVVDNHRIR